LLLVFASQKKVHNVRNEMAESIVPLRKKIKDSLTRQSLIKKLQFLDAMRAQGRGA